MSYETPKGKDYGVNLCSGCFEKQRIIDRQFEEIERLKKKLNANQRRLTEGFFGSSTPSLQVPVKASSLVENQAKKGGARFGHQGCGRRVFKLEEADELRTAEVIEETCQTCQCALVSQSSNKRAIAGDL